MRVLFLAHSFPRFATDPIGSFILRLAVALREHDVEVSVLAPAAPGFPSRDVFERVPVERFRYAPRRWQTLAYTGAMRQQVGASWGARAAMASFLAVQFARAVAARWRFAWDLVHAHWWFPAGLVGTGVKRWTGAPLVTTLHGSDLRLAHQVPFAARLFRRVAARSDAVTTVSRWLADGAAAIAPGVRPVVAPMPVMADLFAPGGERAPDRLLFVGKLNEQKGFPALLAALARMRTRVTVEVVVGVGNTPKDGVAPAERAGVADRIRWHPLLEQTALARLYRECTALVMPAVEEGLGLVAIEASLCGMPVVAYDSGGLSDIVVHERTGLLVPPGDVDALAAALDRVCAIPDRGADWGRAARAHALARFSPGATAGRYADLYRAAVDARRA
jgi:glycosyltransferase involved in cell wall biosynthesis